MPDILVVDDHAVCREPIRILLEREGHAVRAVEDGTAALSALSHRAADVVLLDVHMPGMGGRDVLTRMRQMDNLRGIPVIVLTDSTDRLCVVEMARLGVHGYLSKHEFSVERLLALIRGCLKSSGQAATSAELHEPARNSPTPVPSWPVDTREALRSIQPVADGGEVARVTARLADLKGFSPAITQVMTLTANPRCAADDVAKAIALDQAMSLRILKVANSSAYARGAPVDSVRRAVVQIGLAQIRQIVLALGVVERFASPAFEAHLCTRHFWEHAIACGLIASAIARATRPSEADTAFTTALLHDVGRVMLAEELGEQYLQVIQTARELSLPLDQVETRMLSVNHADVMEAILKSWHVPDEVATPIILHHLPPNAVSAYAPGKQEQVLRLIAANRFAHAMMIGSSGNDTIAPTGDLCGMLGLDIETMLWIEREAVRQTDELKIVMMSRSAGTSWPTVVEQHRDRMPEAFCPLFVGLDAPFDAYRMFCSAVSVAPEGSCPTVAVVHASDPARVGRVGELLLAAEHTAHVERLPTLVLCSKDTELPDAISRDRGVIALQTPTTAARFSAAVAQLLGPAKRGPTGSAED